MVQPSVSIDGGCIVIRVPLQLGLSSTGRSMLLYSSHGIVNTTSFLGGQVPQLVGSPYEGQPISLSLNCFVARGKKG